MCVYTFCLFIVSSVPHFSESMKTKKERKREDTSSHCLIKFLFISDLLFAISVFVLHLILSLFIFLSISSRSLLSMYIFVCVYSQSSLSAHLTHKLSTPSSGFFLLEWLIFYDMVLPFAFSIPTASSYLHSIPMFHIFTVCVSLTCDEAKSVQHNKIGDFLSVGNVFYFNFH